MSDKLLNTSASAFTDAVEDAISEANSAIRESLESISRSVEQIAGAVTGLSERTLTRDVFASELSTLFEEGLNSHRAALTRDLDERTARSADARHQILSELERVTTYLMPQEVNERTLPSLLDGKFDAMSKTVVSELSALVNSAQLLINRMVLMFDNSTALFRTLAEDAGGKAFELAATYASLEEGIDALKMTASDLMRISDELPVTGATLEVIAGLMQQVAATTAGVEGLNRAIDSARISNIAAAAHGVYDSVLRTADLLLSHRKQTSGEKKGVIV